MSNIASGHLWALGYNIYTRMNSQANIIYLFKINIRNTKKVWDMFKINNKNTRKTFCCIFIN